MYLIEMIDDWNETKAQWHVNCSEEEVVQFVERMNNGVIEDLRQQTGDSREYWFCYSEVVVNNNLPTDEDIMKTLQPYTNVFDNGYYESPISIEDIKSWDVSKVPDCTNLFK